jgi:hypothetical protein
MRLLQLVAEPSRLSWSHSNATLTVHYTKPPALIAEVKLQQTCRYGHRAGVSSWDHQMGSLLLCGVINREITPPPPPGHSLPASFQHPCFTHAARTKHVKLSLNAHLVSSSVWFLDSSGDAAHR